MGAIYIVIVMLMRVLQSVYSKKAALVIPKGIKPFVSYVALSKLLAAVFGVVAMVISKDIGGLNAQAILISAVSGMCIALCSICGIKALESGTIVLNSLFGTAGMIIPIILGVFVFDEPMNIVQIICILVLFAAIWLMIDSTKNVFEGFSIKTVGYLLGAFLTNGITMFCQKLFGELQPNGNVSAFSMFTFLIPSVVLGAMLLFMEVTKAEKDTSVKLPKNLVIYALVLAFAVFMIQQIVTLLTPILSSAVLFTFVNGGATVIAAIVGALMYKERITLKSGIGIILALIALVAIKIFE